MGWSLGTEPELAQSQNQNAVSAWCQAGRWELEAKMGDCGWGEVDKKQGQERGVGGRVGARDTPTIAAENGCDVGGGSIGLTPYFP